MDNLSNNPLLTIAIPTFNRLDFLKENLEHLLPQVQKHSKQVEFIISDNFSRINPTQTISELGAKYQVKIQLIRQDENIGGENNNEYLCNKATGHYIYLMGDDDIVSPHFLDVIIPLLEEKKYGLVYFGRLCGDANCSNNRLFDINYKGSIIKYAIKDFTMEFLSSPNFMSSIIISHDCWDESKGYINDNCCGYKWFGRFLYGAAKLNKTCVYYYFPLVIQRNPSKDFSKQWPLFAIVGLSNIFKILDSYIPGVYKKWVDRLHDINHYDIYSLIVATSFYQDFYTLHKAEFYPHLNQSEQKFLDQCVSSRCPQIVRLLFRIKRKLGLV